MDSFRLNIENVVAELSIFDAFLVSGDQRVGNVIGWYGGVECNQRNAPNKRNAHVRVCSDIRTRAHARVKLLIAHARVLV